MLSKESRKPKGNKSRFRYVVFGSVSFLLVYCFLVRSPKPHPKAVAKVHLGDGPSPVEDECIASLHRYHKVLSGWMSGGDSSKTLGQLEEQLEMAPDMILQQPTGKILDLHGIILELDKARGQAGGFNTEPTDIVTRVAAPKTVEVKFTEIQSVNGQPQTTISSVAMCRVKQPAVAGHTLKTEFFRLEEKIAH